MTVTFEWRAPRHGRSPMAELGGIAGALAEAVRHLQVGE
jgi:hypothetical protein